MKIKKNDTVLIISGKHKGKKGKVLQSFPLKRKVIIEGINLHKKHQRGKKSGEKGQIVEIPSPLDVSNVKIICLKCNRPTRIGYSIQGDKKSRSCKKCGQEI